MNSGGRVRLEGIVKRHGALTVLHGIDLDIQPGEFFALLGPSGSGKTTTLRILAGLEPANAGKVWLDDEDVTAREPGQRDVAMVFQSYALYPHMTVGENIAFPLRMVNMPRGDIVNAVREAAAKVRIDHLLERRPGQLSGGQQQRCALARAIVRKPRLFLLDEPLSNLDAKLRLETRVELRKLQRSLGVTTVYVTHDQEEAMTIADRMAVFMEGQNRAGGHATRSVCAARDHCGCRIHRQPTDELVARAHRSRALACRRRTARCAARRRSGRQCRARRAPRRTENRTARHRRPR